MQLLGGRLTFLPTLMFYFYTNLLCKKISSFSLTSLPESLTNSADMNYSCSTHG
jgi:hypothetical protein